MAPNPIIHSSNGLPVCLSGITIPITFSTEIADHDRRRKVFKKKIFGVRKVQLEMRSNQRRIVGDVEDLASASTVAAVAVDLSCLTVINTNCGAKAA